MMTKIEHDIKLGFQDVLIKPQYSTLSSRSHVDVLNTFTFKHTEKTLTCLPIITANMDTTGTFETGLVFSKYKMLTAIHKHYSIHDWSEFYHSLPDKSILEYFIISSGILDKDIAKLVEIYNMIPEISIICLDVANGYMETFVHTLKKVRSLLPDSIIIAGNVVTPEMAELLLHNGADIIKLGIGPGSVCTTRKQTGIGYPQLSAILECRHRIHELNGLVISDGGCNVPGDFSKAFCAGADFVMAGGIFAGHAESGGELVIDEDTKQKYKLFYGMSSSKAMMKHKGNVSSYRSSEGKVVKIPYKGPIENTVLDLLGGIRSTCTYIGVKQIGDMYEHSSFIRVNIQTNNVFSRFEVGK